MQCGTSYIFNLIYDITIGQPLNLAFFLLCPNSDKYNFIFKIYEISCVYLTSESDHVASIFNRYLIRNSCDSGKTSLRLTSYYCFALFCFENVL